MLLPLATRQGQDPVEPINRRIGCLEPHDGPEIIKGGIDIVAPRDFFHDLARPVPQTFAGDHDTRSRLGFDGVARFDIGGAIGANDLPVRPAGENMTGELRPTHDATGDADDASLAVRRAAEIVRGLELGVNRENRLFAQHRR